MGDEATPTETVPQPHLTKDMRDGILTSLRQGMPIETAAELVGTNASAVRVWRAKSRQDGVRGNLYGFDDAVRQALAEGERSLLIQVRLGKPNWRSAAWLLERMYPERYGSPSNSDFDSVPAHPDLSASRDDQAGL